jgi:hypothetical protein
VFHLVFLVHQDFLQKYVDQVWHCYEIKNIYLINIWMILVAACSGIRYSIIYTRNLELLRNEALIESGGDYGKKCKLNDVCRLDLSWWLEKLPNSFNL